MLDRKKIRGYLEKFDFRTLFIEELGWDYGGSDVGVEVSDCRYQLRAIANKRGMVAYQYIAGQNEIFPDYPTRQKIQRNVAKTVHEHFIIYANQDESSQYWQWVKRLPGRTDRVYTHSLHRNQAGVALIRLLNQLVFTLEEEDDLTITDVSGRVRAAFDVEKVTKRFYDRFKKESVSFLSAIEGFNNLADREWYASLILNRVMFIYFIQKRGFLDEDINYLRSRLRATQQAARGKNDSQTFYKGFLHRLFHEGLNCPVANRKPGFVELCGTVPYLNGSLFEVHELELNNQEIDIPDVAFERIFDFFDAYQWQLDDRPLHDDNEINPDVLGYIFEKYINQNQKEKGAYYTKEDITGYISRNTVIPNVFDKVREQWPNAFEADSGIWRLLREDPDRYIYGSVRHGITYDIYERRELLERRILPRNIAAGIENPSERVLWRGIAEQDYGLANETWRECIARRERLDEVREMLENGDIDSINELITYNLNIEKFAQDVIASGEEPELVHAIWTAVTKITILDPACGSGAFLFAALNILEPIYGACLDAMRAFVEEHQERTDFSPSRDTIADFRKVLKVVARHASEPYYILKGNYLPNYNVG